MRNVAKEKLQADVVRLLKTLGINTANQHFKETPRRIAESLIEQTRGMQIDEAARQKLRTTFKKACTRGDECQNLVTLGGKFQSICAHHFLPFRGVYVLSYVPGQLNIGASKVQRLFDIFGAKPQGQELLVHEVAGEFEEIVEPAGLAVWAGGIHYCMLMRGPKAAGAWMETRLFRGSFNEDASLRAEFTTIVAGERSKVGAII